MKEAMAKEKEMHPAYGPPEPIVPPFELYGYVLLESGAPRRRFRYSKRCS